MSQLGRLLDPQSIAIAGLSADHAKHGGRVLNNLQALGYTGTISGVNPSQPQIDGIEMVRSVSNLTVPPDLVVCAVPAAPTVDVVGDCAGVGAVVLFAGGFAESGSSGLALQQDVARQAAAVGVRLLGPNSGGVIRPSKNLAASFLTCLDRPPEEIRSGPVAVVTQSGGTGSYLHNLAAERGGGLAVSVSTGNEADIGLGEAIDAVSRLDEVAVILAVIETVRDGTAFITAIGDALSRGKPVVACRIGTGYRAETLMRSHTGAMAVPAAVLSGILESLGVVVAETPGEAYDVAEMIAATGVPAGDRSAIVTHSGGMAILVADLVERRGLEIPAPGEELHRQLDPLLDHGAVNNPLDMGGIIGGPNRFAKVVETFAESGEYDIVLAVSTAHPPDHSDARVASLLALETETAVLHLWMAGGQAAQGLAALREAGVAVTDEPRAAALALSGLSRLGSVGVRPRVPPLAGGIGDWDLPLVDGVVVSSPAEAARAADDLGYPVVVKVESPDLFHKTEVGGVSVNLTNADAVRAAFEDVVRSAQSAGHKVIGARVEPYRPGLEVIVAAVEDETFGPIVSVGLGGVFTEVIGDVVFAPAPVDPDTARTMVHRLRAKKALEGFRGRSPADVGELARIISVISRGLVGSNLTEVEINPLIWDGQAWVAVDWLTVS